MTSAGHLLSLFPRILLIGVFSIINTLPSIIYHLQFCFLALRLSGGTCLFAGFALTASFLNYQSVIIALWCAKIAIGWGLGIIAYPFWLEILLNKDPS
jgi:hypothetical protein